MDNIASFTDAKVVLEELSRSLEDLDQPLAIGVPSSASMTALEAVSLLQQALAARDPAQLPTVKIPKKKVWSIPMPGMAALMKMPSSESLNSSTGNASVPPPAPVSAKASSGSLVDAPLDASGKGGKRRSRRTRRGHGVWQRPPSDVLVSIFKHLGVKDLCRVSQVCLTWRGAAADTALWTHVDLTELRGTLSDRHLAHLSKRLANAETVSLAGCAPHLSLSTVRAVIALCRGARRVVVPDMPTFNVLRDAGNHNVFREGAFYDPEIDAEAHLEKLLSDDVSARRSSPTKPAPVEVQVQPPLPIPDARPKLALTADEPVQPTPLTAPPPPGTVSGTTTPWGYSTGEEAFPFSSGNAAGSFYTSGEESATGRKKNAGGKTAAAAAAALGSSPPLAAPLQNSSNLFEPTPFNQFTSPSTSAPPQPPSTGYGSASDSSQRARKPPVPPAGLPPGLLPPLPSPSVSVPPPEIHPTDSGASQQRGRGRQSQSSQPPTPTAGKMDSDKMNGMLSAAAAAAVINANSASGGAAAAEAVKYKSVHECVGKVHKLSKSQYGCRFLQGQLEEPPVIEGPTGEKHVGAPTGPDAHAARVTLIYKELYEHAIDLMTDPFGNYLMQKLFEKCSSAQRLALLQTRGRELANVALNTHGTRVVQKIVDVLCEPAEMQAISAALKPSIARLITDLNGNHVVQRCLQRLSSAENQFIYESVAKNCIEVATHIHGCCVFQRCLDYGTLEQKLLLTGEVTSNALKLVCDPFGNYVVQHVLELRMHRVSQGLAAMFVGHLQELSRQKFSSNVVEKSLQVADPPLRSIFVTELCDRDVVYALIHDPYGNYVIQKGLSVANRQQHDELINYIKPHIHSMSNIPYAKRLLERVLKELRGDSSSDTSGREQYHSRRDRKRAAHRARQREARSQHAHNAHP